MKFVCSVKIENCYNIFIEILPRAKDHKSEDNFCMFSENLKFGGVILNFKKVLLRAKYYKSEDNVV